MASSLSSRLAGVVITQSCDGCDAQEARKECPTCLKQGLKSPKYCTQDCFKRNWPKHKQVHAGAPVAGKSTFDPFPVSAYTGSLRACYPATAEPMREVPAHIPRPDYAADGVPHEELRDRSPSILSPEGIEGMRVVCKLAREVLDIAAAAIRPGITTNELDAIVHQACIDRDSYPAPLNYRNFPKSVCTSVNEVICHGIPDHRPLEEGDIINLDVTLVHKGYFGDLNATYPVGKIDADSFRVCNTALRALQAAIAICKPGALLRDIGATIEPVCTRNGCGIVRTYTGHGIDHRFHPPPNILHYANRRVPGTMKPGMVRRSCFGMADDAVLHDRADVRMRRARRN